MKYEKPELVMLSSALDAVLTNSKQTGQTDANSNNQHGPAYEADE
jgi:hypothetical protein